MRIFITTFFTLLISTIAHSQVEFDSLAIHILLSDTLKYHRTYCRQPIAWDAIATNPGNAIKVDNTIYFIPDQYGAVFEIQAQGDSIRVRRIDGTKYSGLTAGQYCFYDEHLYSYGGYGFWHTNGQLRIYLDDRKEWDIVKLNEIIPSTNYFTWYDPVDNMLWCGRQDYVNEVLDSKNFKTGFEAYRLNLKKQQWEKMGSMNFSPTNTIVYEGIFLETPYGVLVNGGGPKFEIWNFRDNKKFDIGTLSDSLRMFFIGTMLKGEHSLFLINNQIKIYDHNQRILVKSFAFNQSDLVLQKDTVYTPRIAFINNYGILLFFLLPLLMMVYYWKQVKNLFNHFSSGKKEETGGERVIVTFPPAKVQTNGTSTDESRQQIFLKQLTYLELELLKHIRSDTQKGLRTKAEVINRILGTGMKSIDVQKKQRSDIIISINNKYEKVYGSDFPLIEKSRLESDGRLFEYYLKENADISI